RAVSGDNAAVRPGFPQPERGSIPEECLCTAIARFRAGRSRHGKKLAITGCTSLRQGAVDGRHVIEALKIICSRIRLTLKAGECTYRESFVIFLIAQKLGRVSPLHALNARSHA